MSKEEVIELSEEEAKIIDFLQRGRSQKDIALDLDKDESTISKKIKDLKERGIIIAYPSAVVDASKLVRLIICGFIKLKFERGGGDWEEAARLISKTSTKIIEVSALFGEEWDIMIKCYVNSLEEYYEDIVKKIGIQFEIYGMKSFVLYHPPKYDYRVPVECFNIKKFPP